MYYINSFHPNTLKLAVDDDLANVHEALLLVYEPVGQLYLW